VRPRRQRPLLFFWNEGRNHWNLVVVRTNGAAGTRGGGAAAGDAEARMSPAGDGCMVEVFEPYGRTSRGGSRGAEDGGSADRMSRRNVPAELIAWLDAACPLDQEGGWFERTFSAITRQHQETGFDCGVACLLYAELVARGVARQDIELDVDQEDFTVHRKLISSLLVATPPRP
jgi:hypothetical protein